MPAPIDRLPRKLLEVLSTLVSPAWWAALIILGLGASLAFQLALVYRT